MRKIYLDSENRCHPADPGSGAAVETPFFDGKCDAFVEGYCCRADGKGVAIYPWQDYHQLEQAQRAYEQARLAELDKLIDALYEEVV